MRVYDPQPRLLTAGVCSLALLVYGLVIPVEPRPLVEEAAHRLIVALVATTGIVVLAPVFYRGSASERLTAFALVVLPVLGAVFAISWIIEQADPGGLISSRKEARQRMRASRPPDRDPFLAREKEREMSELKLMFHTPSEYRAAALAVLLEEVKWMKYGAVVASVEMYEPTARLRMLRIEKDRYNLRAPLPIPQVADSRGSAPH